MTTRKELEMWITSAEAAEIMTKNSGHAVSDSYARRLAMNGRLSSRMIGGKTRLFNRAEVEKYIVKKKGPPGQAKQDARNARIQKLQSELERLTQESEPVDGELPNTAQHP